MTRSDSPPPAWYDAPDEGAGFGEYCENGALIRADGSCCNAHEHENDVDRDDHEDGYE